jgi:hypothetical protein
MAIARMMSLESTIIPTLTPLHLQLVQRIDDEDFSGVKRKVREELAKQGQPTTDEFLDAGILALKQYYAVALLDPTNEHAVSDVIDPFWHAHILHTKEYIAFCDEVFGQYVHHEPLDHALPDRLRHVARLYAYTGDVYRQMFNHIDGTFYPVSQGLPDARLLCSHQEIFKSEIRAVALFPSVDIDTVYAAA